MYTHIVVCVRACTHTRSCACTHTRHTHARTRTHTYARARAHAPFVNVFDGCAPRQASHPHDSSIRVIPVTFCLDRCTGVFNLCVCVCVCVCECVGGCTRHPHDLWLRLRRGRLGPVRVWRHIHARARAHSRSHAQTHTHTRTYIHVPLAFVP